MSLSRFTILLILTAFFSVTAEMRAGDLDYPFSRSIGHVRIGSEPGRVSIRSKPGRVIIRAQSTENKLEFAQGNPFETSDDVDEDFESFFANDDNSGIGQSNIRASAYTDVYDSSYELPEPAPEESSLAELTTEQGFCSTCLYTDDDESTFWGRLSIKLRNFRKNAYLWSRDKNRNLLNPVCSPACDPNYGFHQTRWRTFPPLVCDPPPAGANQTPPPEPDVVFQIDSSSVPR